MTFTYCTSLGLGISVLALVLQFYYNIKAGETQWKTEQLFEARRISTILQTQWHHHLQLLFAA